MNEKRRPGPLDDPPGPAQAVITDLDDLGKVLADEVQFCEICGAAFSLWPPELCAMHGIELHRSTYWPQGAAMWDNYLADKDPERRKNFLARYRIQFVLALLQRRYDLFNKLTAAGVIAAPRQG